MQQNDLILHQMVMMRKYITALVMYLAMAFAGQASQPVKIADPSEFGSRLAVMAASVNSIECRFEQSKYIDVLQRTVVSTGKFLFMKPGMVKMQYDAPLDYTIMIDGKTMKTISGGKTSSASASGNPVFGQIRDMMTSCMTGDISSLSGKFSITYFDGGKEYLVRLEPCSDMLKDYISGIELHFDKDTMRLDCLKMEEGGKDFTEYRFKDVRYNTIDDPSLFR